MALDDIDPGYDYLLLDEVQHLPFEQHGWRVEAVYLSNPMHKEEKYLLINRAFAEKQRLIPFFNRSNNEDLILAF